MKRHPVTRAPSQRGLSLVIVLVLLAAMSLSAAALMRHAVTNEKVSSNFRSQAQALQYAEAALRYCEQRLALPESDPARPASLQDTQLPSTTQQAPAWNLTLSWAPTRSNAAITVLPLAAVQSAKSPPWAMRLPECLVEKQMLSRELVYVITARGFGPDYSADAVSGQSRSGAVVWLQSTVFMDRQASSVMQDRAWRRLLNPPLR